MMLFLFIQRDKEEVTTVNNQNSLAIVFLFQEPGAWISVTMVIVNLFFKLI